MKINAVFVGLAAVATLFAAPALAQDMIYNQGEYFIQGIPASCEGITQIYNNQAAMIVSPDFQTININGKAFDALPPGVQLFAFYDTCNAIFYPDIADADAATVRLGTRQLWLSVSDVQQICDGTLFAEHDWAMKPDATRCAAIYDTMRTLLNQ